MVSFIWIFALLCTYLFVTDIFIVQIAILVDLVKEEMAAEVNQAASSENDLNRHPDKKKSAFWSSCALNIVELILKPPKGGPPTFPEDSEPVLEITCLMY